MSWSQSSFFKCNETSMGVLMVMWRPLAGLAPLSSSQVQHQWLHSSVRNQKWCTHTRAQDCGVTFLCSIKTKPKTLCRALMFIQECSFPSAKQKTMVESSFKDWLVNAVFWHTVTHFVKLEAVVALNPQNEWHQLHDNGRMPRHHH